LLNHFRLCVSRVVCATTVFSFLFAAVVFAANPVPTVTAPVHPQAVVPGSGALTLTVYGANFVSGAVVNWNGSPRSTTFVSARELQARILAADVAKPTAGYITVTNPAPGGGPSSSSYAILEVHEPTATIVPGQPHYYELGFDLIDYLTAADFNGDGKLDLLGGAGSGKIYLFTGNGDGKFVPTIVGRRFYGNGCDYMNTLAFGDFNNDGNLDFVFPAGGRQPPISTEVRLSNGDGTFRTSWHFGKYITCPDFVVGDFNGDGNLDLAAAVPTDAAVHIFLGNGDGTFRKGASYGNLPSAFAPVVADFNGDGKLDLVVDTDGLSILLGNGDGTFHSPQKIISSGQGLGCGFGMPVVVNDFNGDGKMDLAFCDVSTSQSQIGVLLGNGDGTFKKPVYYHAGTTSTDWAFTAGDFTSDGKTDFITWYFKDGFHNPTFAILKGNGDGTFQRQTAVSLPGNIEELGIVPGDFNSDGLLDFIMIPAAGGIQSYLQK